MLLWQPVIMFSCISSSQKRQQAWTYSKEKGTGMDNFFKSVFQ